MTRLLLAALLLLSLSSSVYAGPGPEIIDPAEAAADPSFAIQGEYVGNGPWPGGDNTKIGAQVIAQGEGKFRAVVFKGGLPGDGWRRGDEQLAMEGQREDAVAMLTDKELPSGKIAGGKMTIADADGRTQFELKRTERKSPMLEAKPPKGAVVLFDGSTADSFRDGKTTDMKTLEAGCSAKSEHKMARLHLEFRLSWKPTARGQGRSNSGVYIGGIPEIQVLDSFGLEGRKNECGALYGRREPDVNMCLPPLVWQTFDLEFSEPRRDDEGRPTEPIRVTVRHNGVVIHEDYDTRHKESTPRSLHLQRHGNRVQYRNIWLVEPK